MTSAPAPKEVSTTAGDGRGASSRPPCPGCGRPIPPPLLNLHADVLALLDREGPLSARRVAATLHRRAVDVRTVLHELAEEGLVLLEQPTGSPRSQRWQPTGAAARRGRAWGADDAATGRQDGVPAASEHSAPPVATPAVALDSLLAGLLVAVAYGENRGERVAAAALLALVALAVLAAGRPEPGRARA